MRQLTLKLFSARHMTVTGKFQLPHGRLSQSTNRQSEFSRHSRESRTKTSQFKRTFIVLLKLFYMYILHKKTEPMIQVWEDELY